MKWSAAQGLRTGWGVGAARRRPCAWSRAPRCGSCPGSWTRTARPDRRPGSAAVRFESSGMAEISRSCLHGVGGPLRAARPTEQAPDLQQGPPARTRPKGADQDDARTGTLRSPGRWRVTLGTDYSTAHRRLSSNRKRFSILGGLKCLRCYPSGHPGICRVECPFFARSLRSGSLPTPGLGQGWPPGHRRRRRAAPLSQVRGRRTISPAEGAGKRLTVIRVPAAGVHGRDRWVPNASEKLAKRHE